MDNFIDPAYVSAYLELARNSFLVMCLATVIGTAVLYFGVRGRVIPFMLVTWGLFLIFFVGFFGLTFLMTEIWQVTFHRDTVHLVSLCVAVGGMCLFALFAKIALGKTVSHEQIALDQLSEDELTPFDRRRKEFMERSKDRKAQR
ncbi:MAG: hypothetical protein MUF87_20665 [Anaerolineae bacterium]|jgi:type VI protein secretion system component VasK|nr:hypothetical protein [Anaerolineae bacterium]